MLRKKLRTLSLPVFCGHLLGQRVGHGLGDEGLAAPGRAVEQDALGGGQRVLDEEIAVHVRELDRVGDRLYLRVEASDVGVGDVGHLLEHELLALELGQLLDEQLGAHVEQERVAGAQLRPDHVVGELGHALLVGSGVDDATPLVLELLLERHHLARQLALADQDDVEALVEHHLVALPDGARVDVGMEAHAHFAPAREDVDRAVLVDGEEGAVGRRRLRELLHLLAQRGQLLLGLLQREGELLVLRRRLGQLPLRLEQALLECLHATGALLEPAPERVDLVLRVHQLGAERLDLGCVFVGDLCHRTSP